MRACSWDLFGDERGVAVLSANTEVAVTQEVESVIQLRLQTGREAALIRVGATVQHHFSGLRRVSETSNSVTATGLQGHQVRHLHQTNLLSPTCPAPQGPWPFQRCSSRFSPGSGSCAPVLTGHTSR